MFRIVFAGFLASLPFSAMAEGMTRIATQNGFVSTVEGRDLTRLGTSLRVGRGGAIEGRAFGKSVTGQWRWEGGYFCRDLYFGSEDLGPNCQVVEFDGSKIRFTADQGRGMRADFTLR